MSYVLTAHLRAKAGDEARAAEGLRVNEAASRQEPGCIAFTAYRSKADPRDFFLYEIYGSEADLDAHRATPHFARYVREVVPLLDVREVSVWEALTG